MDKPSFKLVGSPCGQHGQYTFYKALRITGERERIIAIGDFFFVRIWQDSELVSVGELQLLWTDRVSDQTLVSLRLYFLPENTPDGRNQHGQDEVLAISDKVVLRADDLLSWVCAGHAWEWGLRAVWRGACAPPAARGTQPLHHTRLDFSDVEREKSAISEDVDSPGVVVFSYPRYCRYRALLCRLEGLQGDWLRDSLVAALGGYAAPTKNTRILYCKAVTTTLFQDTFEYPELEGHEFVCNQLAPRLKGRPRGRRRRRADRPSSPSSRSSDSERAAPPRRLSLRNGAPKYSEDEEEQGSEDSAFIHKLKQFCRERKETFKPAHSLKDLSLRALYASVTAAGGYEAACARRLWRRLHPPRPNTARRHYERYLLPLEQHEVSTGVLSLPAVNGRSPIPTIELADSPPPPPLPALPPARSPRGETDCEPGEPVKDFSVTSKPAEELNREFLESLPKEENKVKISVKPVEKLLEEGKKEEREGGGYPELKNKLNPGAVDKTFQSEVSPQQDLASNALSSLSNLVNGHGLPKDQSRPAGRSSLRAVRVKPARAAPHTPRTTPEAAVTNFGIHHPAPPSDDEIVEVPYKPATPEIIDLDAYPESPQLQVLKKQKLDILKERGLEVTALPPWPPQVPPQVLPQVFQLYSLQPYADAPPKVIQATSAYGTSGPERTVYGNPRDPFMPPPHVVLGAPRAPRPQAPARVLDLTCRAPPYTLLDGKAVVGSNLEITLVDPKPAPGKRGPQKRSSNGKFVSLKPPKESPTKPAIVVPSFQVSQDRAPSAGPRDPQNPFKGQHSPLDLQPPFVDPAYMSALYSSLAGSMDQRQLALYREFVAHQFRGYSGLLGVTPTTKN